MKSFIRKALLLSTIVLYCSYTGYAQNATETAQQTVNLALAGVMEITFSDINSQTGNTVGLIFADMDDYINGVESADQTLKVRSNKDFDVRVEAGSATFTYSGNAVANNNMAVGDVLKMKVVSNNTGGNITSGFSNYKKITYNDKKIINNADAGDNQTFAVRYKATPGYEYAAGTYSVDIIFTLTEQ